MITFKNTFGLIILLGFGNCSNDEPEDPGLPSNLTQIDYIQSLEDFPNPERGFYEYSETRASGYNFLNESNLRSIRNAHTNSGASYATVNTLVFRYFVLNDFVDQSISEEYLNNMKTDFLIARNAGVKLIPRFTYTTTSNAGTCSEGFICPPYGDATKARVLEHIGQVGPIITENADVVLCLQMGFIGTWGEGYYTDYFGDASSNDQGKLLDENWQDRIDVLQALLDATPKDIAIQVRYPQMKQRFIYGINAPTSSAAITETEAFIGTDKARITFHNDCLFASSDDFGTYEDYGNSSTTRKTDLTTLKSYFADDGKYGLVGGETCWDGYSPQNNCAPEGKADTDLRSLHYTYLNSDYNNEVNNDWVDGGCMDAIKRELGYRIVLESGGYTNKSSPGDTINVSIKLSNIGFAAPVTERPVQLILRGKTDRTIIPLTFDTDVRFWFSDVILSETFTLPANIALGEYELLLNLPDKNSSISDRFEYSIRLANDSVWEEASGYNNLQHIITLE